MPGKRGPKTNREIVVNILIFKKSHPDAEIDDIKKYLRNNKLQIPSERVIYSILSKIRIS